MCYSKEHLAQYENVRFSKKGEAMHTCNEDVISGLPFGRKAEKGVCLRCDELRDGAKARGNDKKEREARELRIIAAHFNSEKHLSGGCGVCCTFGEW